MFKLLNSQNRYAILYRIANAKRPETRARRIAQFVEMLARGETIYPEAATQIGIAFPSRRIRIGAARTLFGKEKRDVGSATPPSWWVSWLGRS